MKIDEFLQLNRLKPTQYPAMHLDTYSYCNAKCIFCGYHTMTRPKGNMSKDTLHHVLDEIAGWDTPLIEIVPIHFGEFFLNPDWLYILQCIESKLPNTAIAIPTNGSVLDDSKIDELVKIKTLHYISFSVYAFFEDTYRKVIGLDPVVLEQIANAIGKIIELRPDIMVGVGMSYDIPEVSQYETALVEARWNGCSKSHLMTSNLRMNSKHMKNCQTFFPCLSIFESMIVLWDGRVSMCCYDPNGETMVGSIYENTILDIWYGDKVKLYQSLHNDGRRNEIQLCGSCSFSPLPSANVLSDRRVRVEA